jgi:hypothetical protein
MMSAAKPEWARLALISRTATTHLYRLSYADGEAPKTESLDGSKTPQTA